jgi:cyclophilin family peptidyl-prolyl cis-trans isomerase
VAIQNARRVAVLALMALLAACGQQGGSTEASKKAAQAAQSAPPAPAARGDVVVSNLKPLPGHESNAPRLTKKTTVRMQTTAGDLVIDVFPDAAPNAAKRFIELVNSGFYDDTPISRVVPGFVAQFGVNWREPHRSWKDKDFDDDPSYYALERGTLAFAKSGANMNSTQVFINYRENNRLADPRQNFTVFGEVVSGMDVVDKFVRVGDPNYGLDQNRLWQDGGTYLDSLAEKPTMIQHAEVVGAK